MLSWISFSSSGFLTNQEARDAVRKPMKVTPTSISMLVMAFL